MGQRRTTLPDPAGLCGLIVFLVLAISNGSRALRDGDTLWHIKFGALMLKHGALITHDEFSHTAAGQPWFAHEWLSEVIMAALHGWAGLPGVTLFYFAIVGLTFAILFKIASRLTGDGPALVAVAIALPFAMTHLLARPHVLTWCGAALSVALLTRGQRSQWLLIPLTALWANLHAGVLFGLAIQFLFIFGGLLDDRRSLPHTPWSQRLSAHRLPLVVFLLSLAATCLNPFGYHLFTFPFKVAAPIFVQQINEWKSPDFQQLWYFRWWVITLFFCVAWLSREISWRWRLLAVFLLWQAFGHVRHASLAVMLLTPCMALIVANSPIYRHVKEWRQRRADSTEKHLNLSPWTGPLLTVVCCIIFITAAAKLPPAWQPFLAGHFSLPKDYSQGAIDYLRENGYPGKRLLNDYEWGDYLLYAFETPPKIFIDGRADMYGERIFSEYVAMADLSPQLDNLLVHYGIDWILFPSNHPLVRMINLRPDWRTLYRDDQATILARKTGPAP